MNYPKSNRYPTELLQKKIMGPNPIKLLEELLRNSPIQKNALVLDLGSGTGLTSVFLAKEYGYRVIAADLWSNPTDNRRFFEEMGLTSEQILPLHADATALPFAEETFDAVVSTDSYHYFGREPEYLQSKLLPYVKHGGYVYIAIPGMKKDCHQQLPPELLLSWTAEDLDTMHDAAYWRSLADKAQDAEVLYVREMESNAEVWNDWLQCDNSYAVGDRKSMNAGAGKYLNFIEIALRRR